MARERQPRRIDDGDGITDRELLDLASDIAPNDYFRVGLQLGITYRVLDNTKRQHRDNYIESMHEILHLWKDRQGPEINTREELYQRLRVAGLDQDGSRLRIVPNRPAMWKCMCIVGFATAVLLSANIYILLQGTVPSGEGVVVPVPGKNVRGCASSPCLNEGTCIDLNGTFKCKCKDGLGGSRCDEERVVGDLTLNKFQDLLRDEYERRLFKIKINPLDSSDYVDFENLLTDLSLYTKDKMNIPDKPARKIRLRGSINDVFQTKIGGKLPERIVLVGEAGRGKTTAVAKMAYDWVNRVDGSLKEVPLLFVLIMRHLKNTTSLAEGVLRLLGQKYVKDVKYHTQLKNWTDSHEKDVFILMDGYDEYSGSLQANDSVSDVIDILRQKSCKYCKVLVTTRPFKETDFTDLDSIYAKMILKGYSEKHAMFFIDKFFESNETKGTALKRYLEDEPVMREMITTPLFCTLVCYMWSKDRLHGSYTRTAFFDNIMDFLLKHSKSKKDTNGMTTIEQRVECDDLLIYAGEVAYHRMLDHFRTDLLLFTDRDFIKNHTLTTLCFRIGLLTKTATYDEEAVVYIEFFHKLAQEYAAGKYLSNQLNNNITFSSNLSNTISEEVLQFASGTSDVACKKLLHDKIKIIKNYSPRGIINVLKLISEADKCAENSKSDLLSFFRSQRQVQFERNQTKVKNEEGVQLFDLRTIIGFEKLPAIVKNEVTGIDARYLPGPALRRLWSNLYNCTKLYDLSINAIILQTDLENMLPLPMVKSFAATVHSPDDFNTEIFSLLPNLERFRNGDRWGNHSAIFTKVWNKLSDSLNLSWLNLCIPSIVPSELIALKSIKRFETCIGFSSERVIGILPKLPNINVFVINPEGFGREEELKVTFEGFSELWSSLSISQHLHRIELFLPPYNLSASRPFTTVIVEVFPWYFTKYPSSGSLLNVLAEIPNIHELNITYADLFEGKDTDESHAFFRKFWRILYSYTNLTTLRLLLLRAVPSELEKLTKITTFEAIVKLDPSLLSGILDLLPSVQELRVTSYDVSKSKSSVQFHDVFLSTLADSVMKRKASLKDITLFFYSDDPHRKPISRDTVRKFMNMLKSSPEVQYVDIHCMNNHECLFMESDFQEILKATKSKLWTCKLWICNVTCSSDSNFP